MKDKEKDDMVKAYVDNMPDMVLNSNGIMNWRVFFNEVAKKVAGAAYKDGINAAQEQMMKDAVEREVKVDAGGYPYIDATELYDYDEDKPLAKEGDKVKVLIIKEDEL